MRGEQVDMSADVSGDVAASGPYTTSKHASPPPIATPETPTQRLPHTSVGKHGAAGEEENARSAFAITSVTDAPADADDLETSIRNPGQSSDEQQIKENLASKRGEVRGGEGAHPLISNRVPVSESSVWPEAREVGGNGMAVVPLQQGASRFRRVNQYIRGRWVVRDTSEPEERTETSDNAMGGRGNLQPVRADGIASPSMVRRGVEEVVSTNEVVLYTSLHSTAGGGSDTASDKGDLLDRSSTAAETVSLSRHTSMSSLTTTEKMVDIDEHLRDVESDVPPSTDPVTYSPSSVPSQSTHTAASSQDNHGTSCSCESCAETNQGHKRRVKTALESLQEEMDRLLESNSRLTNLTRENERLQEEKTVLRQRNTNLSNENEQMRSRLHDMEKKLGESASTIQALSEKNTLLQEVQSKYESLLKERNLSESLPARPEPADEVASSDESSASSGR